MKVSVIIPSYKPESYLFECLDSLYKQTLDHHLFEVLIILNGCKEPYYTNIQIYIRHLTDLNIQLIQTDVPGVSNARNLGIDQSVGEYITFIDDDDLISETYLSDLLAVSSSRCIGCANSYAFSESIMERKQNFLSKAFERCKTLPYSLFSFRQFLSPPVVKLIHRNLIGATRFPISLKKSEDSVFCLQLTPRIKELKLTDGRAIYYQRIREGSAMRKKNTFLNELIQFIKLEIEYIRVWSKAPFSYNLKFFLSRMVAGCRNFWVYITKS